MQKFLDAILSGSATAEDYLAIDVPESYRGLTVHAYEAARFEGLTTAEKDPRKSLHLEEVAVPELGPGEALIAVMAMGGVLQRQTPAGSRDYSTEAFKWAFATQYALWLVGITQTLRYRRRTIRGRPRRLGRSSGCGWGVVCHEWVV